MSICNICPRNCGIDREKGDLGFCRCGNEIIVSRAAPHFGEEPCISGTNGSGAVFFSGCNMHCVFCQNSKISFEVHGKTITVKHLAEIFNELEEKGVHNLNLITPTHYSEKIIEALKIAKPKIPVVWNSSAYEKVETLKKLEGLVQIYLPDFKYSTPEIAKRYSGAFDYPEVAKDAIKEMYRQTKNYKINKNGLLESGIIIRHLILPGLLSNTYDIIDWIADTFDNNAVLFSLMSQFTPLADCKKHPEINRTITPTEYAAVKSWLDMSSLKNGYFQELTSATCEMIPNFDGTGV